MRRALKPVPLSHADRHPPDFGTSAARRNGRSHRDFVATPVHPHSTPVARRRYGRSRVFTSFRLEPFAQTQLRTHQASR